MRDLPQIDPREPVRNESLTIGTSSTEVGAARKGLNYRKELLLRNVSTLSTQIISISVGVVAQPNQGIVLRQYESIGWSAVGDDFPPQGQILAISAVAGASLAVFER